MDQGKKLEEHFGKKQPKQVSSMMIHHKKSHPIHQSSHSCNDVTSWAPIIHQFFVWWYLFCWSSSYLPAAHAAKTPSSSGATPASQWRSLIVSLGTIVHNIFGPLFWKNTTSTTSCFFNAPKNAKSLCFHNASSFPGAPNVIWKRGSKKLALPKGIVSKPAFQMGNGHGHSWLSHEPKLELLLAWSQVPHDVSIYLSLRLH